MKIYGKQNILGRFCNLSWHLRNIFTRNLLAIIYKCSKTKLLVLQLHIVCSMYHDIVHIQDINSIVGLVCNITYVEFVETLASHLVLSRISLLLSWLVVGIAVADDIISILFLSDLLFFFKRNILFKRVIFCFS